MTVHPRLGRNLSKKTEDELMRLTALVLIFGITALLPLAAQSRGNGAVQCPVVKVEAERLPDMNLPRMGHTVLCLNGEPTAIGGHTTNFVPTPTLEYFKDGKWHLVDMAFSHDDGCAVELSTGKVLIFGGHEKNLGIGQTFEAEFYDPKTRECQGFASIDTKRALASALAMDDGRAIIAGNWYHKDDIEMYDGKVGFMHVKDVSVGRCSPYILRIAKDDAIIIGGGDTIGQQITHPVADRLRGELYHVPLLDTWRMLTGFIPYPSSFIFIGDEAKGDYSYLLPVKNDEGQIAIARVTNGEFSLLQTDVSIPKTCQWGEINYYLNFLVDRKCQRAYLLGMDAQAAVAPSGKARIYVVAIDYATTPAHLTLYYTDVLSDASNANPPLLTPDGDIMLMGGAPEGSYFKPTAATWLLHVSPYSHKAGARWPLWAWLLVVLMFAAVTAGLITIYRRRKRNQAVETPQSVTVEEPVTALDMPEEEPHEVPDDAIDSAELMQRLGQLMEEQQLFLKPDLKVTEIASTLGTSRNVLSNAIKTHRNCTFPQFINTYRIAYAQELMRHQPNLKMTEVYMVSGFSSETSFYRTFKTITGFTPTEWKCKNDSAN